MLKRLSLLLSALALAGSAHAVIVALTFSSNLDTFGETVFGQSGPAVPFTATITYDTELGSLLHSVPAASSLGAYTTIHPWFGYSVDGIVDAEVIFGTETIELSNFDESVPAMGFSAALWVDADLNSGSPSLAWLAADPFYIGSGMADATFIFMQSRVSIDGMEARAAANDLIVSATSTVPEPAMTASLGGAAALVCAVFARRRLNRK